MTDVAAARAALADAQDLMTAVAADNARLDETLTWLTEAAGRAQRLEAYYTGDGEADVATVLADDPQAVTPPVANQDAAWETLADRHDAILRLLRFVTDDLTA